MITIVRCYPTLLDANKRYLCWKPLYYKHLCLQTVANSPTEIQCVLARVTNLWALLLKPHLIFLWPSRWSHQRDCEYRPALGHPHLEDYKKR
jgi:hypothetical protein